MGEKMLTRCNSLSVYFALLLLPGLLIGGVVLLLLNQRGETQLEGSSLLAARGLSRELDQSMARMRSTAAVLAAALPASGEPDGAGRRRLLAALPAGAAATLLDAGGAPQFTTAAADAGLSPAALASLLRQLGPGAAPASACVPAAVPQVAVAVALTTTGGGPAGVLVYQEAAAPLFAAAVRDQLADGWIGAWIAPGGVLVGRSTAAARYVGHPAIADLLTAMQTSAEGMFVSATLEGTPSFVGYSRSAVSGCTVAVFIPRDLLRQKVGERLRLIGGQIAAAMLLACLLAWALLHRALASLRSLRRATALAAAGAPGARATLEGPAEIRLLARQFNRLQQARERADARVALAASVFGAIADGILIVGPDHAIIEVNRAFETMSGYTREQLIGQNPRLLKSGKHDAAFYQGIWRSLDARGHWHGQIWDRRRDGSLFAAQLSLSAVTGADGTLLHYIAFFSDITEQRLRQDQVEQLAYLDPLTHLPNRRLLRDRLTQGLAVAARSGHLLAVCSIDLDGFKAVNDSCGHEAGDAVLVAVAARLLQAVRANDTVARLGGDEFVLVLAELGAEHEAVAVVERALDSVRAPIRLASGRHVGVSASIGLAFFPRDGATPEQLLGLSDDAMYAAKHAGRDCYREAGVG
jgi:diguanylate cyclase (GGDEF)-like protein/PAS domain S-box-containing protein